MLVALNLSAQAQTVMLSGPSFVGAYQNVFTDEAVSLEAEASIPLPAWGYMVYEASAINTDVAEDVLPGAFMLHQNYPNPFNPTTTIAYILPTSSAVRLTVYDVRGRAVRVLTDGLQPAGSHEATLDATGLPSGVYFYRLEAGHRMETKRLVLLR